MAEEQVIIQVDLNADGIEGRLNNIVKEVANLKNQQAELNKMRKDGTISDELYIRRSKELSMQLSTLQRQQTNLTAAIQTSRKTNDDYGDSLDEMRAKLNDMQKTYATLTKAQRESAEGQQFLQAIVEQDKAVKGLEQSIGDARRNVGDYEGAIKRAFPAIGNFSDLTDKMTSAMTALGEGGAKAMKGLVAGLGNATKAALRFIATPIGAIIAAIAAVVGLLVAAFGKLREAFAKNDDAGTAMARLLASFEPIIDKIDKAFVRLAEGIGKVANKLADWIGKNNEAAKAAQDLVTAQDELEERERQYVVSTAEREKTIAKLRTDAKDREQYTAEERKRFILEAIDLEEKQAQETKEKAAEKLRILEETAKKESDTSDATKDKIAAARAEMIRAETDYYNRSRELLEQRNTAENEYQAEMKARAEERMAIYYAEYEMQLQEINRLKEGMEALANVEKIREEQRIQQEQELAQLRAEAESYVEEEEMDDVPSVEDIVRDKFGLDEEAIAYYNELLESGMSGLQAFDKMQEYVAKRGAENFATMAGSLAKSFNDIAGLLNEYGENSKSASKASKAFALAGIIAGQAQSIANTALSVSNAVTGATAAAAATGPAAPFTIGVYITSMVGAVLAQLVNTASAFIEAKQLLSNDAGSFAQGGIIGGTSYSGDKLTARVNSGEMVLTKSQQANLFQMANNPTGNLFDYDALAAAIAAQPAPVMDYTEFKSFEHKISTYKEIASV